MEPPAPPQHVPVPPARPDSDAKNLKLLSVFHYVLAGLSAVFACCPLIHVAIGFGILARRGPFGGGEAPPAVLGWVFAIMGLVWIMLGWTMVALLLTAAKYLRRRRRRVFCLVVAGLSCAFMPFGTVLGVFSIVFLCKPSVKALFES